MSILKKTKNKKEKLPILCKIDYFIVFLIQLLGSSNSTISWTIKNKSYQELICNERLICNHQVI